jgi:hypothetical protein
MIIILKGSTAEEREALAKKAVEEGVADAHLTFEAVLSLVASDLMGVDRNELLQLEKGKPSPLLDGMTPEEALLSVDRVVKSRKGKDFLGRSLADYVNKHGEGKTFIVSDGGPDEIKGLIDNTTHEVVVVDNAKDVSDIEGGTNGHHLS